MEKLVYEDESYLVSYYLHVFTPLSTVWERNIHKITAQIREKPQWAKKYKNPEIFDKWKQELMDSLPDEEPFGNCHVNYKYMKKQIDQTMELIKTELEWWEKNCEKNGFTAGPNIDVWYSDSAIDSETKQGIKDLAFELEKGAIDWHPGSNEMVRDLIHPSLFPIVFGRTKKKKENGDYEVIAKPKAVGEMVFGQPFDGEAVPITVDSDFQWLPSLYDLKTCQFNSYINNLHPEYYKKYYPIIGKVLECALPGLNLSLSSARGLHHKWMSDPSMHEDDIVSKEFQDMDDADEFDQLDDSARGGMDPFDYREKVRYQHVKPLNSTWTAPELFKPTESLRENYENLKVITKMANVHLTPENPRFGSGSWHLEGTGAEDIVATVLYYYDSENITESRLNFRATIGDVITEIRYEQHDETGMAYAYGFNNSLPCLADIGSVNCIEDRLLVFPNRLQHKIEPFELSDKTKPGHRKILAFFICSPKKDHVLGSDVVNYQNEEWVLDNLAKLEKAARLPQEILDMIIKDTGAMSWKEAQQVRSDLMKERSVPRNDLFSETEHTFNLCEH